MPGFLSVLVMSALLGVASFAIGILPLSFAFSKSALARLSALGTGLLIGAALGVIIPEGLETLVSGHDASEMPTSTVAVSLMTGFTFMLLVEQLFSPHAHSPRPPRLAPSPAHTPKPSIAEATIEFDVELGDLERTDGIPHVADAPTRSNVSAPSMQRRSSAEQTADGLSSERAFPLTLGLVMHALADGLALGSSALSDPSAAPSAPASALPSSLSLVVFLALAIHKAPTALALTTSLMSTSLPRVECKKHIAVFSASTPLGALASYAILSFFGTSSEGRWPGVALLISGGTFLYVATVLRPVSGHGHGQAGPEDIGVKTRVIFTVLGMFVPFVVSVLVGHDHAHGA